MERSSLPDGRKCKRLDALVGIGFSVLAAASLLLAGCSDTPVARPEDPGESPAESDLVSVDSLAIVSDTEALDAMRRAGFSTDSLAYLDIVPYQTPGTDDFDMAWAGILRDGINLRAAYVDAVTGGVLAAGVPVSDAVAAHVNEVLNGANDARGINQYESYPWGYDLPVPFGNRTLTCGYGCGEHRNNDHYAIDLALSIGTCVPAPGSGWCMFAGDRGDGYGKQVIVLGGTANGTNRYLWRVAHLSEIRVTPGWWIDKSRTVGLAGCSGQCTGPHVHSSVHRGYYSSGRIVGESVPWDRWPGPNDRVDYFNRSVTTQFSFNVCH